MRLLNPYGAVAPRLVGYFGGIFAALVIASAVNAQELVVKELWRTKGGTETVLLAGITGMAEAADGSIWVSDGRVSQVLSIDSVQAVRVVARRGEGPGEVRGPSRIAPMPAGGLAIYDLSRRSIELFGPDGKF